MKEWYYVNEQNQSIGPLSFVEMKELIDSNQIHKDTMVFKTGMEGWTKLEEVSAFYQEGPPQFIQSTPTITYPMKWYKFEVNFAIWFSVFVNVVNAFRAVFGSTYELGGFDPTLVYSAFNRLVIIDRVYGIIVIALSIAVFRAGIGMRHMKKNSWKQYLFFTTLIILSAILDSLIGYFMIKGILVTDGIDVAETLLVQCWSYILNLLAGISLRYIYYRKRDHLFNQ